MPPGMVGMIEASTMRLSCNRHADRRLDGKERKEKAVGEIRSSREKDPLGYDGDALERLRAMAGDELVGIGADAVEEEASVLRARLGLRRPGGVGHE